MKYKCIKCGRINHLSNHQNSTDYLCYHCETALPSTAVNKSVDTSTSFGMVGGAALGGIIAGPVGVLIGAIVGTTIGRYTNGLG